MDRAATLLYQIIYMFQKAIQWV